MSACVPRSIWSSVRSDSVFVDGFFRQAKTLRGEGEGEVARTK